MGEAYSNMGQDVSRAVMAAADGYQREQYRGEQAAWAAQERDRLKREEARQEQRSALDVESHKLNVTNMALQNELLKSQLARQRSAQLGPPMPTSGRSSPAPLFSNVPGKAGVGIYNSVPAEVTTTLPGSGGSATAGPDNPMFTWYDAGPFSMPLLSSKASEAMEGAGELLAPILMGAGYSGLLFDYARRKFNMPHDILKGRKGMARYR